MGILLRGIVAALVIAVACGAAEAQQSRKAVGAATFGPSFVPGEVVVRYKPIALLATARASALASVRGTFKSTLLLARTEVIAVPPGTEVAAAAALAQEPDVAFAEPNRIFHALTTPDDSYFNLLWGLNNTGQNVNGIAGTSDADIDAPEAWALGTGITPSVIVADIDTGVFAPHPDLTNQLYINPGESGGGKENNNVDDDGNGFVDDYRGWDFVNNDNDPGDDYASIYHGTHVAGTIAAESNNGAGVAGVASFPTSSGAWKAPKILVVKVLDSSGNGSLSQIVNGFAYASLMGARVANVSLGGAGTSATIDSAIAAASNTLFAIAAGNNGTNNDSAPFAPCVSASTTDQPNKICVAATDPNDARASFSNFGATTVDLGAPGVNILSAYPPGGTYQYLNGTSMATPHVAGAAAFLMGLFPTETIAQIKNRILQGVDPDAGLAGITVTGGRLNLYKAATYIAPSTSTLALSASPAAGGTVSGAGTFATGGLVTAVGTPNGGYNFSAWTEGGFPVSPSSSYAFTLSADRALVGVFTLRPTSAVFKKGGRLYFAAGKGLYDNLTVAPITVKGVPYYLFSDPYSKPGKKHPLGSRLAPTAGCITVTETSVRCPAAGISQIVITLGDMDDTADARKVTIPVRIDGGPGNDLLTGGMAGDTLIGGPGADSFSSREGNDVIKAWDNEKDIKFNCGENAGDVDTVQADLSPNDPVTASAANCEVVVKKP